MTTKVTLEMKIHVNGREYESVDQMPADVRQGYERALASMSAKTATASGNTLTTLVFNGQVYASVDEMPAAVRHLYEGVMATVDANRNGIPDVLETIAQGPTGPSLTPTSMTVTSVAGGMDSNSIRNWLIITEVVIALLLLCSFLFGR